MFIVKSRGLNIRIRGSKSLGIFSFQQGARLGPLPCLKPNPGAKHQHQRPFGILTLLWMPLASQDDEGNPRCCCWLKSDVHKKGVWTWMFKDEGREEVLDPGSRFHIVKWNLCLYFSQQRLDGEIFHKLISVFAHCNPGICTQVIAHSKLIFKLQKHRSFCLTYFLSSSIYILHTAKSLKSFNTFKSLPQRNPKYQSKCQTCSKRQPPTIIYSSFPPPPARTSR